MKKTIIILAIIAVVLVGGFFLLQAVQRARTTMSPGNYETETVQRGSLTATIGATGFVNANQSTVLNWQTSGIVETVLAKLGEDVTSGAELAALAEDSLSQNVILAQAELIEAQKALDELLESDVAREEALQAVYTAENAVIEAERALDYYDSKTYKDALDDAREQVIDKEDDLDKANEDFEPYQDWDEDNETRQDYEQKVNDAQNAYDEAIRKVDQLELEKQEAEGNLATAHAHLDDAQRAYERIQNGPNPDDVAALEARIAAAQATLDQAHLSAPFAGTVTQVTAMPGDRVNLGSAAVRLDDLSRLLVDVGVSEVDINSVQVGKAATLIFDAVFGEEYNGVVSEVSEVGTSTQGVVEFAVTVELTDADEAVKPGMTAAVNIVVDQIDDVLLVPNRAVRILDGKQVVYILENGRPVPVEITLGASSDVSSEVIDGDLREGDVVVLNPPAEFQGGGGPFRP